MATRQLPGSDVLVVTNSGLITDLATGDDTRNIETMTSNLTYLSGGGAVLDQTVLALDLQRCSIRHLTARADGLLGFAM